MSDIHWERVKEIFEAALERSRGAEREAFLRRACGADAGLREEVGVLIASFEEADDFLDDSPIGEVADAIVGKTEEFAAGDRIGRYLVERKIGAGGMGEVYLAYDSELERPVAVKILSAAFAGSADRIRRFAQEARAASALNHPNILTIYEVGRHENWHFIAAEYVAGETLRERLRRSPFSFAETLDVFAQIARALDAAHRAGVAHRDIKPENIMIRGDRLVKVLDFGLAKISESGLFGAGKVGASGEDRIDTLPGLVMGTVAYMSPEQARGLATDARSDIWSLGVCLYETVFGKQPFAGETASDQIAAILKTEAVLPADLPPALRRIFEKSLAKNAADRYQTVEDFSSDLKDAGENSDFGDIGVFSFIETAENRTAGETAAGGEQTDRRRARLSTAPGSLSFSGFAPKAVAAGVKNNKLLSFLAVALTAALSFAFYSSNFAKRPGKQIASIAVLSFANESADAGQDYLSDGLSERLINNLSQLPQLKVAARSSAFKYKHQNVDAPEIARALGVEAIVTGALARRGDELRVTVELIDAADNTQIWGETYRRQVADAQTVEEEIAQTIAEKLRLKLTAAQTARIGGAPNADPQAYQLYLNGVFYRRQNGTENWAKAIEYQKQAIQIDPNFALAYAELGTDYFNFVGVGDKDSRTGLPPAREAIEKALALDDSLAEAHTTDALIKAAEFRWAEAEDAFRRALELNPNVAITYSDYALMLAQIGRFDEALAHIRKAFELDPLRVNYANYEGAMLLSARRFGEARRVFDGAAPEAANETFGLIDRARLDAAEGRFPEAIARLEKSLGKNITTSGIINLGCVYARAGDRRRARAQIERLKTVPYRTSPAELAALYAALGEREKAFELLEQAFDERDNHLANLRIKLEYDVLRDDRRFQNLLSRLNFPR